MEDNTKRLDKTLDDLTLKDIIVVGAVLLVIRDCSSTARRMMIPKLRKWNEQLREKNEELKAENAARKANR